MAGNHATTMATLSVREDATGLRVAARAAHGARLFDREQNLDARHGTARHLASHCGSIHS